MKHLAEELRRCISQWLLGVAFGVLPKGEDDRRTLEAFAALYAAMLADSFSQAAKRTAERKRRGTFE